MSQSVAAPPPSRTLYLASASPRRQELLTRCGIPLTVLVSAAQEVDTSPDGHAAGVAALNARLKAEEVAARVPPGSLVLGADTIVVVDDHILGKPVNAADGESMLRRLSGREHQVMTGFCLLTAPDGPRAEQVVETLVQFKPLSEREIQGYLASGEPFDKAGAYGIQGIGAFLVTRVDGSYTNVVGLPLAEVLQALTELGGPQPFAG